MAKTVFKQIIEKLDSASVNYQLIQHQPAVTSAQADNQLRRSANQGAKCIIFKLGSGEFKLCVVRTDKRVDFKKLKNVFRVKKARLATADEVKQVTGVEIGACYPFADIAGVEAVFDQSLEGLDVVSFSPGTKVHHIVMKWSDLKKLTQARLVDIACD